jgi:recombination protein RecA
MTKVKVVKNKIFAPFKVAELPFKREMGYDKELDIIEAAMILGFIDRAGAFYTIGDQKVQGKEKLCEVLKADNQMRKMLEQKIQQQIKDMRIGKKVLDDKALAAVEIDMTEEINEELPENIVIESVGKKKSKK